MFLISNLIFTNKEGITYTEVMKGDCVELIKKVTKGWVKESLLKPSRCCPFVDLVQIYQEDEGYWLRDFGWGMIVQCPPWIILFEYPCVSYFVEVWRHANIALHFHHPSNFIVSPETPTNNKAMAPPALIDLALISDWVKPNCEP